VIDALIQSVKTGEISEQRIDDSVGRILEAKARLGLHKRKLVKIDTLDHILGSKTHLQFAQQAYEGAITLVKNDEGVLPLSDPGQKIAVFSLSSDPGGYYAGRALIDELRERFPDLVSFYAEATTGEKYLEEGKKLAEAADVLLFALFSARRARKGSVDLSLDHIKLVREAARSETPVVVISFGSPYFLRHFPEVDAYMCVYRYTREAQITAVKALLGEIEIRGRLPVSIPELFPMGHGLILPKSVDKPISQ
jgi:beta-N-acetylhexosaminidase